VHERIFDIAEHLNAATTVMTDAAERLSLARLDLQAARKAKAAACPGREPAIVVWEAKRFYHYVRPVTAIRFRFSSQPVRAWAGPYHGTRLIPGDTWQSYVPTPPFAEYVSGHSTFSAASAEILRSFTGSDHFWAQVTIRAGGSPIEPGLVPREAVTLAW
jgi:hypothetical protein